MPRDSGWQPTARLLRGLRFQMGLQCCRPKGSRCGMHSTHGKQAASPRGCRWPPKPCSTSTRRHEGCRPEGSWRHPPWGCIARMRGGSWASYSWGCTQYSAQQYSVWQYSAHVTVSKAAIQTAGRPAGGQLQVATHCQWRRAGMGPVLLQMHTSAALLHMGARAPCPLGAVQRR